MGISRLTKLISLDLSTIPFCELPSTFDDPDFNRIFSFEELHRLRLEEPNLQTFVQNMNFLKELNLDNVDLSAQGSNWSDALALSLPNLQVLSLSFCRLSGPIRPSFSRLQSLSYISLDGNHLSSEVPRFLAKFSNLVTLSLRSCDLHGNFPENVFTLPKLQIIDLSDNSLLTGQFPKFPLNNSLLQLRLYKTNFHGKLPDSIGNLKFLKILLLYACDFNGSIPSSLANLSRIVELDLSDNSFTGSIPPFHASAVPGLADLRLSYNLLSGVIDSSLFTLPSLQSLRIDNNHFTNQLEEFSNASSSVLEYVYLHVNGLSGPIPMSISKLPSLTYLSLASNNFNGTMKLDIFQGFENLTSLDLSDNRLAIEPDNGNFTFPNLVELRLSGCNLTEVPKFLKNENRMMYLNVSNNKIHGGVPSWIWNSSTITELDLSQNAVDFLEPEFIFNGDEYPSFSVLGKLAMRSCNISRFSDILKHQDGLWYLDLSDNGINGRTPSWIWKKSLQYLNISHNDIYGLDEFLPNMSTPLETLDLHANMLQGSLPKAICNLSSLSIFDASHNKLSGLIPECLVRIGNLSVLNLKGNNYRRIPPNFALARSLRSLNVNGNQLEGELPRSLANCTMLEVLDLGNNKIMDTFPFWLEKLPELKVLVLRANRFNGQIDNRGIKFLLPNLGIMDLSSNEFTGELSKEFFQSLKAMAMISENKSETKYIGEYEYYQDSVTIMSKGFEMVLVRILNIFISLDLSNNKFNGEIPEEIRDLKSLVVLNLSRNNFDGHIPPSLRDLSELESLDLSRNKLSGMIPTQLVSLTFLSFLDISYNQLSGHIPQGGQFNTFLPVAYEGNIRLCGLPLSKKCKDSDDTVPAQAQGESSETGSLFDFDLKIVSMGYGCGLVIGISIAYYIYILVPYTFWSKMEDIWFNNFGGQGRKLKRISNHGHRFQSGR